MGWGDPPHEGYEARLLRDGRMVGTWSAETDRESTGLLAVLCSCGWRGDGLYRDYGLNADGERWWPDLDSEAQDQAMHDEWWNRHMAPMVEPDPNAVLVLGGDAGGPRHFLAGQPVHAGTALELRLPDDRWVLVRYEWNWDAAVRPRAHLALGGRGEALGYAPDVDFPLPERAELRWPAQPMRRRS
jgi:hypothetical protein